MVVVVVMMVVGCLGSVCVCYGWWWSWYLVVGVVLARHDQLGGGGVEVVDRRRAGVYTSQRSPLRASLRLELHVRHEHHHNLDDFYILFHANFQNGKNFPF